jgi:hypothetical protein
MCNIPSDCVRFYEDGANWPTTPETAAAEREYRKAFYNAACESMHLQYDELLDAIEEACEERQRVREQAEVLIPSSVYFNHPGLDSEQIAYRRGHEVNAARVRGRHQALDLARQFWDMYVDAEISDEIVQSLIFKPWADQLKPWTTENLDTLVMPVDIEEIITDETRRKLFRFKTIVDGLLRGGEIMDIIYSPDIGASFLASDLAISVAAGRKWLDNFPTCGGKVLVIDTDLHPETFAYRIQKIAYARDVGFDKYANLLFVENLRCQMSRPFELASRFSRIEPGQYAMIILDNLFGLFPSLTDKYANTIIGRVYSQLKRIAMGLRCGIVCLRPLQSGDSAIDTEMRVGGDTRLILRRHKRHDAVIVESAASSQTPIRPFCLRRTYPVWTPDDSLGLEALQPQVSE